MKTKNWKYLKYLFWLGPVLTMAGLTAGYMTSNWGPLPLGLLIAGLVIIGLWLIFVGSSPQGFWRRRSTQVGTNALAATLAMLVILGLINFLSVRHAVRMDLTDNQLFTLAPQSQQVVRNLQQPVKVWVFEGSPNPADLALLENYRRYGSQFSFEFVDPQLKLGLAQKFNVQSAGEVYLESGERRRLIQTVNAQERLTEAQLTNSIEQIISQRQDKVYFLQGHGEHPLEATRGGLSQAVSALKDKNYITEPLTLTATGEIPKDASVVVVAGPKRALFEAEVRALNNYLKQGGSVLLMVNPNTTPGLDSLVKEWGVQLDNALAVDASGGVGLGPAVPLVTDYGDHPITKDFGKGISFYPLARPIQTIPVSGIKETTLLITNPQSWAESNPENKDLQFDPETDRQGPLALGAAFSRVYPSTAVPQPPAATSTPTVSPTASPTSSPTATASPTASPTSSPTATASPTASPTSSPTAAASPTASPTASPNSAASPTSSPTATSPTTSPTASPTPSVGKTEQANKPAESRLVVLGNSDFATDGLFEQQLNGDVFLNSVSWLSKRDQQALSIRPKTGKNRRINLNAEQVNGIGWVALAVVPLLGLLTAGLVWWRRR